MRRLKRKINIFCIAIGCMLSCNMFAFAENGNTGALSQAKREVRVGYKAYDNMVIKDEEGNYSGYGVSYLKDLSNYTGWDLEFIELGEEEGVSSLINGDVDLLCDIHKDNAEKEKLIFSNNYADVEYGMLCALEDNDTIFYDDYEAFNGKKIGINRNGGIWKTLPEYAREKGITYEPVYFDTYDELVSALRERSVDMALMSSQRDKEEFKYVGKTGIGEEYFATRKGNEALMGELNRADEMLKSEYPFYVSRLYMEYYGIPARKLTGITREEHEFIKNSGPIRVVCGADSYPIEYIDDETDAYSGVYAAAVRLIEEESGLDFEFIPFENFPDALEMIKDGEADLIAGSYGNSKAEEYYGIIYSESYLSAEYTLIGRKVPAVNDGITLALPQGYVGLRYFFQENYPDSEIVLYDTINECFTAVNDGDADFTSVNSLFLQTVYNLNQYDNLKIVPNMTTSFPISMGIGKNNTQVLKSILDKAIYRIPDDEFEKCITEYAINISYRPSFLETVEEILPEICAGLLIIAAVVAVIIKRRENHYRHLAMTDSVTKLWNRVKFYKEAQETLEKNKDKTYLLITLDINKFRFINNDFGSKVGDNFLYVLGRRIHKTFEGKGLYARNRADLFMVLIEENLYRPEMLEDLSQAVYFDNNGERQYYKIIVKAGIRVIHPEDDKSDLILYVDQSSMARKSIKENISRNQAYYDEQMKQLLETESQIENRMEEALQNREFQVYLQPKYNLHTEKIKGAEALVRWMNPERGMIPPDSFIPLFEKNGFVLKLDFYVYEEVMRRMSKWLEEGRELISVSVNVSRVHIGTLDFFDKLNRLIEQYQIPKEYFELELTETIMGGAKSDTRGFIRECKEQGYPVSIDDFGSGYSSLNLLKDLPVDILKIDKGFLDETEESERSIIIVEQVVEMAKRMEIGTVCEGVETEKQAIFLKKIGCDMAQGYLFSRPVPMDEFEKLLN